jgi:hypothetical protein
LFPSFYVHSINVTLKHEYESSSSSPLGHTSCSTSSFDTAYNPISAQAHLASPALFPNTAYSHVATIAKHAVAYIAHSAISAKAHLATIACQPIAYTANPTNSSRIHIAAVAKHSGPDIANHAHFSQGDTTSAASYYIAHNPNHNPFNPHHSSDNPNHSFPLPTPIKLMH